MNKVYVVIVFAAILQLQLFGVPMPDTAIEITEYQCQTPVLIGKENNPLLRIKIAVGGTVPQILSKLVFNMEGTTSLDDVAELRIYYYGSDSVAGDMQRVPDGIYGGTRNLSQQISISGNRELRPGIHYFWVSVKLHHGAALTNHVDVGLLYADIGHKKLTLSGQRNAIRQRIGVAVRQHMQDGVHTSRIPGLATTNKGTLLAIFDARYESSRDLQGSMDIGLHRSTDGGQSWSPLQIAMDMGEWGGLPQKFNGVSDACILVDKNSDVIYIAGLWMHGVINESGEWVEGLTEASTEWNHQWRNKGSQPGFGVKQTSQFLIVKSTDDGKTWGEPVNLTEMCKKEEWWLWAPAPGNGITLEDGTLVFPTQGRDKQGRSFSNIIYSKDKGSSWSTSNQALHIDGGTTECAVVQLSDGSLMLNMRANKNRGNSGNDNGRIIAATHDLGGIWREHPTSSVALPEPTCMASLYKHGYLLSGLEKPVLLFSNPNSKKNRDHITIKLSTDDGNTWPKQYWLLLDEGKSRGYSCITSVDKDHIGILYESSQADLVFQKIGLGELMKNNGVIFNDHMVLQ